MCFSAQASFTAAATLSIIGLAALKKAKTKSIRPFAAVPLFFGIQQLCEGFVWTTLNSGDTGSLLHLSAMYGFLFFAGSFWPTYIPYSLSLLEQKKVKKRTLNNLLYSGSIVAAVNIASWVFIGITAEKMTGHIAYTLNTHHSLFEPGYYILLALYCMATIGSFFVSSIAHMWVFGAVIATAFVVAQLHYYFTFSSIWCFFAALASVIIYAIVDAHAKR